MINYSLNVQNIKHKIYFKDYKIKLKYKTTQDNFLDESGETMKLLELSPLGSLLQRPQNFCYLEGQC